MKKMYKILSSAILLSLTVLLFKIIAFFNLPEQQKANMVHKNMNKIYVGMPENKVLAILSNPDSIYFEKYHFKLSDSVLVYRYYLGFGAPDVLRIFMGKNRKVIKIYSAN